MSILKQKIKACKKALERKQNPSSNPPGTPIHAKDGLPSQKQVPPKTLKDKDSEKKKRKRLKGDCFTPKCYLQTKNIVTNFGKAIASFAMSDLATPYLITEIDDKGFRDFIEPLDFKEFMKNSKGTISSIDSLRKMLMVAAQDTAATIACKKCFQTLAEIFIKFFSVNWIIHGRVTYKLEHLKFRNRMLRRVQNPEVFTYLKGYNDKKRETKIEQD